MMDDFAVWQQWLKDWHWYNFMMVFGGIVAVLYGSSPLLFKLRGGRTIKDGMLSSVLDYKIGEDTTVKEALIFVLLFPPCIVLIIVVSGLAARAIVGLLLFSIWLLNWILDSIGAGAMFQLL